MDCGTGEIWAGLSAEGVRMSAAAVLRRLAALAGGKPALAVLAPPEIQELLADAACEEGWGLAEPEAAEAALIWAGAVQTAGPRARWVCHVFRDPGSSAAGPGLVLRKSLPFRGYLSITQLFGRWARKLGVPAAVGAGVSRCWQKWGMAEGIGGKMAALPLDGWRETHWAAEGSVGGDLRGRWADLVRDGVATFGWIGHVPLAGALLASLVTALAGWLSWGYLEGDGLVWFRGVWAGVALASIWGCLWTETWAAEFFLAPDPREVVLDETAGMATALLFLPERLVDASPGVVASCFAVAFVAFRLFDMLKAGIRWVERTGWRGSIVWDDILAGIYAGAATWFIAQWLAMGS